MKINLLYLLFVIIIFSCASCSKKDEELTYYPDGNIKSKVSLKEGKLDGLSLYYYPNGKLKEKSSWKSGKQDGLTEFYFSNGQLENLANWKDGEMEGLAIEYFANGQVKSKAFRKGEKYIGEVNLFSEAGTPIETKIYDNFGRMIYAIGYDEEGNKEMQWPMPLIEDASDTVTIGDFYKTSVKFAYPLKGDVKMVVGNLDKELEEVIDTIALIQPSKHGEFVYSVKADKLGRNSISVKFLHQTSDDDTMKVDNLVVKHNYYVKANR